MGAVARRYAKALYEVADERGQLDLVEEEINQLDQIFIEHPTFLKFLHHPLVEQKAKKQELQKIFGGKVSDTMLNLLNILIERNREEELHDISHYYVRLANRKRGLEDATVFTREALTDEKRDEIAKQFETIIQRKIRVHNQVDESVLGGVKVKIGDRVYDGSVQGRLNRFKQRITKFKR